MAKLNLLGKVSTFGVAVALSAMMVPAVAMADDDYYSTNSDEAIDNVVTVNWEENGTECSCDVDLDKVWAAKAISEHSQTRMGALYAKTIKPEDGSASYQRHSVIATDKYVTLQEVLDKAKFTVITGYDEDDEPITAVYHASDVWDNASDTLSFDVWDKDKTTGEYSVNPYTKYKLGYTKAKLDANGCNNFYGNTTANNLASDTTVEYTSGAILALNGVTQDMTDGDTTTTASDVLSGLSSSSFSNGTSPRLMWGYESSSIAGNRFPSNIDAITVYDVA